MKALNQNEIANLTVLLSEALRGLQLQEVISFERGVALRFHHRVDYWLVIDLFNNAPVILLFEKSCPVKKLTKPKPVGLFINAHVCNLSFQNMQVLTEFGRVVKIEFKNSTRQASLEIRLIPKQSNLLVTSGEKVISWSKPLELTPQEGQLIQFAEIREFAQIHQEWLDSQQAIKKNSIDPKIEWEKKRKKDLDKKQKALIEIRKTISEKKSEEWVEVGYWLKEHGMTNIPENQT